MWLTALDAHPHDDEDGDGRLGLHGRVDTQLLAGEPVTVVGDDPAHPGLGPGRLPVAALSPSTPRGYPGWVRACPTSSADDTGGHGDAPGGRVVGRPPWGLTAAPTWH